MPIKLTDGCVANERGKSVRIKFWNLSAVCKFSVLYVYYIYEGYS